MLGLAQSGVSRHLGLLKDAGLVAEEPAGGFTYYRLDAAAVRRAASRASGPHLQAQFDEAGRLRRRPGRRRAAPGGAAAPPRELRHRTAPTPASSCPAAAGPPGPGPSATSCPRSTWPISAAATATSPSRPPRWAQRVYAIDRSAAVLQRARALAREARRPQHRLEAGRDRARAAAGRVAWTWPCSPRRCTMRPTRRVALAEAVRVLRPGRPRPAPRPAAARPGLGEGAPRRPLARLLRRRARLADAARRAAATSGCSSGRARPAARSPSRLRAA